MNSIQLEVTKAEAVLQEATNFYTSCGRSPSIDPNDKMIIARFDSSIVGAVRLCIENGTYTLRTMQVREDFQRQGLGKIILIEFEVLLKKLKINRIYCMPYLHLESFYGFIGFKTIETESGPLFLQKRVSEFHQKYPDRNVIVMVRE